jgi:hypothetical protein
VSTAEFSVWASMTGVLCKHHVSTGGTYGPPGKHLTKHIEHWHPRSTSSRYTHTQLPSEAPGQPQLKAGKYLVCIYAYLLKHVQSGLKPRQIPGDSSSGVGELTHARRKAGIIPRVTHGGALMHNPSLMHHW